VQGGDVGVALYDGGVSDNIKYVGLSSGKLAQYLKYGLPIIVNDLPMWNEVIPKYQCGEVIINYKNIRLSLEKIFANNEKFEKGALNAFDSLFSLESYTPKILKALRKV
jgi:hypothetical protein